MSSLIARIRVPMVMVVTVAVGAFTVPRLRGIFGSFVSVSHSGTADLIIEFRPRRVICEVYGPAGRVAAGALRCWVRASERCGDWWFWWPQVICPRGDRYRPQTRQSKDEIAITQPLPK
jgi:Mycobacterium membrane protein